MTPGHVPTSSDINYRELYVNAADGLVFTRKTDDSIVTVNPPAEIIWNGATAYKSTACAAFASTGTTDSNGRVVFNLTKDGTASGTAIFSKVFAYSVTARSTSTTDVTKYPHAVIEAVAAKTATVRLLVPTALLALGNTAAFAGAGFTCDLVVWGSAN